MPDFPSTRRLPRSRLGPQCRHNLGPCCDVAKLPLTNNERKQRAQDRKHNRIPKEDQKLSLNSEILKSRPLWSTSFYRETNELFTYRDYPRVKRIIQGCTRLFLENLHQVFT
jgi:hypothetical protein